MPHPNSPYKKYVDIILYYYNTLIIVVMRKKKNHLEYKKYGNDV